MVITNVIAYSYVFQHIFFNMDHTHFSYATRQPHYNEVYTSECLVHSIYSLWIICYLLKTCNIAKLNSYVISLGLLHSLTNLAVTMLTIIKFCWYVYIMDSVIALILARVIGRLPRAISLQSWYISVVSWALVICLICTPTSLGLWSLGSGVHIRKITWVHDTTSTCVHTIIHSKNHMSIH